MGNNIMSSFDSSKGPVDSRETLPFLKKNLHDVMTELSHLTSKTVKVASVLHEIETLTIEKNQLEKRIHEAEESLNKANTDTVMEKINSNEKYREFFSKMGTSLKFSARTLCEAKTLKETYLSTSWENSLQLYYETQKGRGQGGSLSQKNVGGEGELNEEEGEGIGEGEGEEEDMQQIPEAFVGESLKIKLIITDIDQSQFVRSFFSPILTQLHLQQNFGFFHTALQIGPWLIEWTKGSLCIPRKCVSQAALLSADVDSLYNLNDVPKVIDKIADEIVRWNCTMEYAQRGNGTTTANCQDFVEAMLNCLNVKPVFSESIGLYLKKMKENGLNRLEIVVSDAFRERYHLDTNTVQFPTHRDLDRFVWKLKSIDEQIGDGKTFGIELFISEFKLLKSFDRAFWMRYFRFSDKKNFTVESAENYHYLEKPAAEGHEYSQDDLKFRRNCHCFAQGTLVRMEHGSLLPVERILPGQAVLGPDGLARKVIAITKGFGDLFEVSQQQQQQHNPTYKDNCVIEGGFGGCDYICNAEHLLCLVTIVQPKLECNYKSMSEKEDAILTQEEITGSRLKESDIMTLSNYDNSELAWRVVYMHLVERIYGSEKIEIVEQDCAIFSKKEEADAFRSSISALPIRWTIPAKHYSKLGEACRAASYQEIHPILKEVGTLQRICNKFDEELHSNMGLHIPKVAWFLGLWIGSGSCSTISSNDSVTISLNETNEKEKIIGEISNLVKVLGLKATEITDSAGSNRVLIVINNSTGTGLNCLCELLKQTVVNYDNHPQIPTFLLFDQIEVREYFLAGLIDSTSGRAVRSNSPHQSPRFVMQTLSTSLKDGIVDLGRSLGIPTIPCMTREDANHDQGGNVVSSVLLCGAIHQDDFQKGVYVPCEALFSVLSKCVVDIRRHLPAAPLTSAVVNRPPIRCYFTISSIGVGDFYGFQLDGKPDDGPMMAGSLEDGLKNETEKGEYLIKASQSWSAVSSNVFLLANNLAVHNCAFQDPTSTKSLLFS